MIKMNNLSKKASDQQGFASIVIALILIIVLALMTVGFAQLARREQQTALDKQLSDQASYAAETGINDIYQAIDKQAITAATPDAATANNGGVNCLNTASITGVNSSISVLYGISYTCALVNLTPSSVVKDPLNANTAWDTVFSTTDPSGATSTLGSLVVNWSTLNPANHSAPRASADTSLPPLASWSSPDVLQVSITPLGALDEASLSANTFTAYLYPSSGGTPNTVSYSTSPGLQGQFVSGDCTNKGACSATINNFAPLSSAGEFYLLHITSMGYDDSSLSATAFDASNNALNFKGSEAVIDVTGKAKNVLKRLRAVVSLNGIDGNPGNIDSLPNDTVEAQDVCKRFDTYPASTVPDSSTATTPGCTLN
jgi:Tfp pilus assembly protein PilX